MTRWAETKNLVTWLFAANKKRFRDKQTNVWYTEAPHSVGRLLSHHIVKTYFQPDGIVDALYRSTPIMSLLGDTYDVWCKCKHFPYSFVNKYRQHVWFLVVRCISINWQSNKYIKHRTFIDYCIRLSLYSAGYIINK